MDFRKILRQEFSISNIPNCKKYALEWNSSNGTHKNTFKKQLYTYPQRVGVATMNKEQVTCEIIFKTGLAKCFTVAMTDC